MSKKNSVFLSILSVSSLGILAKVIGLFREGVVAAYFGASAEMDLFSVISSLMTTIITIFASSASLSYLPIFVKNNDTKGINYASKHLSNLINQYVVLSLFFYLGVFVLSPFMPEVLGDSVKGIDESTVVLYSRLLFSTIIASGFSRLQLCALSGLRKYGWLQITTAIYSIISIILTVSYGREYGVGVLVASYIINSIIQLFILQYVLRINDCKYSLTLNFKDKDTLYIWKTLVPVFLGSEVYMLGLTIDRTIGISLGQEGVASSFNYAGLLYGLINMVISGPIIKVFYTELSKKYVNTGAEGMYTQLCQTITSLCLVLLPVAFFLCANSYSFVDIALQRGAFTGKPVEMTSLIFSFYVVTSPVYAFRSLLAHIYVILHDQMTPMKSGFIFLAINIIGGTLLARIIGVWGICLSAFLAMSISGLYLYAKLRRVHSYHGTIISKSSYKTFIASVLSMVILLVMKYFVGFDNKYLSFVLEGICYLGFYLVILKVLKVPEYINIESKLLQRFNHTTK